LTRSGLSGRFFPALRKVHSFTASAQLSSGTKRYFDRRRLLNYCPRVYFIIHARCEREGLRRAKGGAPMIDFRIVAILIGVVITFTLQNGLDARWYVSLASGVIGYLVARFLGRAINDRLRFNKSKQRDPFVK
jgi:hypothetical protein